MIHSFSKNGWRPVVFAIASFVLLLSVTQYVAFQQYHISQERERELLFDELDAVKDRFRNILNNDITAANTLAIIYKEYGVPRNYDSIGRQIISNSKYADAIALTQNGILTHVYPDSQYKRSIGVNTHHDPQPVREELEALKKGDVYFAGPRELRIGGIGILGKVPIIANNRVRALVVVLTKLETINKALKLNGGNGRFAYTIRKKDITDTTHYYLTSARPYEGSGFVSVAVPEGNWTLSVAYTKPYSHSNIYWMAIFGFVLSLFGAAVVYDKAVESHRLKRNVEKATHALGERVKELSAIFLTNQVLRDDWQTPGDVLERIVNVLPSGWQYSDVCAAKIIFNKRAYTTNNYRETAYKQTANIQLQDGRSGFIEVCYLEERPAAYEGPFLKEERDLLNTIAETIEMYFNKKAHQDAVSHSEANMRTIIESSQVGFMLCDTDYRIIAINRQMAGNYEMLSGRLLKEGDNFIDALLPDRKERVHALLNKMLVDGKPIEYDSSYSHEGGMIYVTVSFAPVVSNGKTIGLVMASYDITARKQMELERQRIIEDLTERNKALEDFAHVLSHNVRAPLSTIMGLSDLFKTATEEERAVIVDGIARSSEKLDDVLKNLNVILQMRKDDPDPE